jgi:hypothetical protein
MIVACLYGDSTPCYPPSQCPSQPLISQDPRLRPVSPLRPSEPPESGGGAVNVDSILRAIVSIDS